MRGTRAISLLACIVFGAMALTAEDFELRCFGLGPINVHASVTFDGKTERLIATATNNGEPIEHAKLCLFSAPSRPCFFELSNTAEWKLLIKPRHGMAARGIFSVRPIGDGHFIVGGKTVVPAAQLAQRLTANAQQDCLLLQSYIEPCASALDLSPNAPAVVRISTFRSGPGAEVAVASAEMKIPPPDLDAPVGVTGQLIIPINVVTGALEDGILLSQPSQRWYCSPWNQAPVRGRFVPEWAEVCDMVIRASAILPGTPVIGWDVLFGPEGPFIIEANTGVGLFRAMFWNFETGVSSPLPGALEAWRLAIEQQA